MIILAGDIAVGYGGFAWARTVFPENAIVYVAGNHEAYCGLSLNEFDKQAAKEAKLWGINYLQNHFVKINGVRIVGFTLWTDFDNDNPITKVHAKDSMNDYRKIGSDHDGHWTLTIQETHARHIASINFLKTQGENADVIVSHHAPSFQSIATRFKAGHYLNGCYASALEPIIHDLNAKLWVHGHIHEAKDYRIGDTRIVANPRGYPGEPNVGFDPELVIEI